MKIILPKNRLLEELFPQISNYKKLKEEDLEYIKQAYTIGAYKPQIEQDNDSILISIDEKMLKKDRSKFQESLKFNTAIKNCENREFSDAMQIVDELLDDDPLNSEFHRVKGQIFSETGSNDEAVDELIEALRLDPENTSALTMLGNIYSREKGDIDTAIKFYEKVLELNPDDHLALNNIGSNLAQSEKYDEAQRYFDLAHDLNPTYPNTLYGLALLASKKGNYEIAFKKCIETFENIDREQTPGLFKQTLNLAQESAVKLIKRSDSESIIDQYKAKLERKSGKPIEITSTKNISTPAKLEVAEVHNRDKHLVKFKPDRPAVEHLTMHELVHLELILEARENNSNKLFTSDRVCRESFENDNKSSITKSLQAQNIPKNKIDGFLNNIFQGLNSQIYNTPIDLLIEQRLFNRHTSLHPFQFMSLLKLEQDYITSATDENIKKLVPKKIHQTNKILSLINTLQFRELYHLDLIDQFEPTKNELERAQNLYENGVKTLNNNKAGIEYRLVQEWAEVFDVHEYFKLVDEEDYASNDSLNVLDKIEQDPLSLENQDNIGKESFSNKGQPAGEMASTMYILDALQYFEDKSTDEIRKVGFEIGMLGRSGIDTNNSEKKYSLKSVPEKKFSGMHLLAYMYTAFQEFEPDLDTGIDFEEEYEQALTLFKQGY